MKKLLMLLFSFLLLPLVSAQEANNGFVDLISKVFRTGSYELNTSFLTVMVVLFLFVLFLLSQVLKVTPFFEDKGLFSFIAAVAVALLIANSGVFPRITDFILDLSTLYMIIAFIILVGIAFLISKFLKTLGKRVNKLETIRVEMIGKRLAEDMNIKKTRDGK